MIRQALLLAERQKQYLLAEMIQVRGLLPLLMKPRNQQPWSDADRYELKMHLRRLRNVSPYLVIVVMPGGFVVLPLLAWWLDRRRGGTRPSVQ